MLRNLDYLTIRALLLASVCVWGCNSGGGDTDSASSTGESETDTETTDTTGPDPTTMTSAGPDTNTDPTNSTNPTDPSEGSETTPTTVEPETCEDGILNQDETDIDCGGSSCPLCALDQMCEGDIDCESQACVEGTCIDPECLTDEDCPSTTCAIGACNDQYACEATPNDGAMCTDEFVCTFGDGVCMDGACIDPEGPEAILLADIDGGDHGYVINGEKSFDFSGFSVRGAGDVNGDGFADTILGAFGADPFGGYSGRSYVIFGKADGDGVELADVAQGMGGGFTIDGEAMTNYSGYSVAGAGDVNGDGFDDLVVGAYRAAFNGINSGRTYVVFGKGDSSPVVLADVAAGTGGFVIEGEANQDFSGFSVQGGVDINGDDLDDVVLGAFRADGGAQDSGKAYVVFGKETTDPVSLSDVYFGMEDGFAMSGANMGDFVGTSVAGVSDMNGDGLDEVIVGAFRADPNGDSSGATYVVFGKQEPELVELASVANGEGGFVLNGEAASDFSGYAVTGLQDMNDDGRGDFAIGAWRADPNGSSSGRAYVIFGTDATDPIELTEIAAGNGGFVLNGEGDEQHAGIAVGDAGDVNGDGKGDLIVGASGWADGTNTGRAYVFYGTSDTTAIELAALEAGQGGFVLEGESGEASLAGRAVSGTGDVNNDGFSDLVVGASLHTVNGEGSGRTYVIFGGDCQP